MEGRGGSPEEQGAALPGPAPSHGEGRATYGREWAAEFFPGDIPGKGAGVQRPERLATPAKLRRPGAGMATAGGCMNTGGPASATGREGAGKPLFSGLSVAWTGAVAAWFRRGGLRG